jgi:DNA-binding XRE family transcriptional regulator
MDCRSCRESAPIIRHRCPLTSDSLKTTMLLMQTRLREWREKRGLSLRKLGERSGVHYISLVKLEAGRLDPQLSTLLKLCQALRISLSQLVGETNKKGGA